MPLLVSKSWSGYFVFAVFIIGGAIVWATTRLLDTRRYQRGVRLIRNYETDQSDRPNWQFPPQAIELAAFLYHYRNTGMLRSLIRDMSFLGQKSELAQELQTASYWFKHRLEDPGSCSSWQLMQYCIELTDSVAKQKLDLAIKFAGIDDFPNILDCIRARSNEERYPEPVATH